MREHLNVKLWTERKALSRGRWLNDDWEGKYCVTWGNRAGWKKEKRRQARSQRRMMMEYELGR